jgi:hypothetical protein
MLIMELKKGRDNIPRCTQWNHDGNKTKVLQHNLVTLGT